MLVTLTSGSQRAHQTSPRCLSTATDTPTPSRPFHLTRSLGPSLNTPVHFRGQQDCGMMIYVWDRAFYNPNSNCTLAAGAPKGAEGTISTYRKFEAETKFLIVVYAEPLDFDLNELF